jgi:hypothetical protein
MTGSLVISLDCEGKWGMADQLAPYHHAMITDEALTAVYDDLLKLFAHYDLPVTFAFVLAFTLGPDERSRLRPPPAGPAASDDAWLGHYWEAEAQGHEQGWFQPRGFEAVRADSRHEIACHGFCHRPLSEDSIDARGAGEELDAALAVARSKGVALKTMVFPRNQIGHLPVLQGKGFIGYRERRFRPGGRLGRLWSLAEEFNIVPSPEARVAPRGDGLVPIPAGYFFNWRFGARRRVPAGVTVRRWKTLLNRAARTGKVAHLWLHPHNLITAPSTRAPLEIVLRHAAELRSRGLLEVVTQERYCQDVLAAA